MAVSSIGIGSGLDVESIVTQMVELEKRPIKTLEVKAEVIQSKISTYGQIKSLTDDLNAAVRDLTLDRTWTTVKISSSAASAVSATMTGSAQAGSYNIYVERLAQAQTSVTDAMGKTETAGAAGRLQFSVGGTTTPIAVTTTDTLESIVAKINSDEVLSKSVVASAVKDATGNLQLMVRARETGLAGAFSMTVVPDVAGVAGNLSKFAFLPVSSSDPAAKVGGQVAQDAEIKLNGVTAVSSSNVFADLVPGLSITVSEQGKSSILSLAQDQDAVQASIQKFVDAYNAFNDLLTQSTAGTRTADGKSDEAAIKAGKGVLQGDSSTVSLQNSLRMLTQNIASQATGAFTRLSDAGIQMLQGGKLSLDSTKMATALGDMASLKSLFAAKTDSNGQGGGLATAFKAFTDGLLSWEGGLNTKTDSLEGQLQKNAADTEKVNQRANTLESRLRSQYTALDVKMASLNSLSSYVEQMVSSWNKSKD